MTKKIIVAVALLAAATTAALAQSQPNQGPNRNTGGDTFGKVYSGSAQARHNSGGY